MLKYKKGDLFKAVDEDNDSTDIIIIPHVVNNQNSMGSGFVVPLNKKWPSTKVIYHNWARLGAHKLGDTMRVRVEDNIWVIHMCAQTLGGNRPLYYNSLVSCMQKVVNTIQDIKYTYADSKIKIWCPKFGSALAGGNWDFIECLIEDIWIRDLNLDVTVFYL